METDTLLERRKRTHAIVEGALLGDIAVVFLMMRVYLPVPVVRTLLRTLATVPFVLLLQRRGLRITILAAIASYVLFSALVGPILALAAIDIAVSGILIGLGRSAGIGPALNTLWTAVVYTALDVVFPTIVSIVIFRYPVKDIIQAARHFIRLVLHFVQFVLNFAGAPHSAVQTVHGWEGPATTHWIWVWLASVLLYGLLNQYLAVLVSEIVLNQLPHSVAERQEAAA